MRGVQGPVLASVCSLLLHAGTLTEAQLAAGGASMPITLRHKYAEDVPVELRIEMGGEPWHDGMVHDGMVVLC